MTTGSECVGSATILAGGLEMPDLPVSFLSSRTDRGLICRVPIPFSLYAGEDDRLDAM